MPQSEKSRSERILQRCETLVKPETLTREVLIELLQGKTIIESQHIYAGTVSYEITDLPVVDPYINERWKHD